MDLGRLDHPDPGADDLGPDSGKPPSPPLQPGLFPPSFRDPHTGTLALYFEPAAVIVTLVLLGQVLELRARSQTSDLNLEAKSLLEQAEALRGEGQTVMFVTVDGRPAGLLGVADPIKESTHEAIRLLHEEGIRVVMQPQRNFGSGTEKS